VQNSLVDRDGRCIFYTVPGLIGGLVGGVVISICFLLWESSLPSDFLAKGEALSKSTPLLTRILYGGITEEPYNSLGRGETDPGTILWDAFLNRYFPAPPVNSPTLDSAKNDANAVSGNYIISRRSESLLKSLALLAEATVSANEDDTISVSQIWNKCWI
jgi:hypothetical protein